MRNFSKIFLPHVLLLILLLLITVSCSETKKIDVSKEREAVKTVLDDFIKAHEIEDLELLKECFSPAADILIIGTDENEIWVDREAMVEEQKRAYDRFEESQLSVRDEVINMCDMGNVAWFYMKVNWKVKSNDEEIKFDGVRTTGVLEKEDDQWNIIQMHTSIPVYGQAIEY